MYAGMTLKQQEKVCEQLTRVFEKLSKVTSRPRIFVNEVFQYTPKYQLGTVSA
jgi:hypothetical protein